MTGIKRKTEQQINTLQARNVIGQYESCTPTTNATLFIKYKYNNELK